MNELAQVQNELQSYVMTGLLPETLLSGDRLSAVDAQRLAIYRNAYQARLVDALHENHGALESALGTERFRRAGAAYVRENPSSHRNIRWFGATFWQFLSAASPWSESPWISELARFEWVITVAFDAASETPLSFPRIASMPPEAWTTMRFTFHASAQIISLSSNAPSMRSAHDASETLPLPVLASRATPWLVWRRADTVFFRSVKANEIAALQAAMTGHVFPEICEVALDAFSEEAVAMGVAGALGTWIDEGLIVEVNH